MMSKNKEIWSDDHLLTMSKIRQALRRMSIDFGVMDDQLDTIIDYGIRQRLTLLTLRTKKEKRKKKFSQKRINRLKKKLKGRKR